MGIKGWIATVIAVCLALGSIPYWLWLAQPTRALSVLVVDKTVPDRSYREHLGLFWILNRYKFESEASERYAKERDYAGFVPYRQSERETADPDYGVRDIPNELRAYDMIYLADTYGVYEEDYREKGNRTGERSGLLYGGLAIEEANRVRQAAEEGTHLVAEFNTFGSPTSREAAAVLYDVLGVRWTGWIGRYFEDLGEGGEVPLWLPSNYENQTGQPYEFEGPGFAFVSDEDQVAILQTGKDVGLKGCRIVLTERGESWVGRSESVSYSYWFDVVEPLENVEILARYEFDWKPSGQARLEEFGIPASFPAIVHRRDEITSYYFAGDYADQAGPMPSYRYEWGETLNRWWIDDDSRTQRPFYWKIYVPLMKTILQNAYEDKE